MLRAHLSPAKSGKDLGIGPNGPPWYMMKAAPAMPDIGYVNSNKNTMHQRHSSAVQKRVMIPASRVCHTTMTVRRVTDALLYLKVISKFCTFLTKEH